MTAPSHPADGGAWQPAPSGNRLARDGGAVVKRFGARLGAFAREGELLARLGALADPLPVPRLLPPRAFGELRSAYVDGVSGVEALAGGLAPQVLAGMGAVLGRLHALDPEPFADVLPGAGPVVAHGDFAPHNVLVDPATGTVAAVLDWEEARRDTRALDLAWCEAQVLARLPYLRGALRHLYDAYGATPDGAVPDRAARERALERRTAELRSRARADAGRLRAPDADALYRCTFADVGEAAAFVAALSRALAGPAGAPYRAPGAEALVWAAEGGRVLYLSDTARRATVECFGAPSAERVDLTDVPAACELLYGAGAIPAWGTDAARRRLTRP